MALEQKLNITISQKLVMTPALQQAISLLQKNRMELMDVVKKELVENPVLDSPEYTGTEGDELSEGDRSRDGSAEKESDSREKDPFDEIDMESYFNDSTGYYYGDFERRDDLPSFESTLKSSTSLAEYLLWQLGLNVHSDRIREIGEAIIGNLNDKGYLQASLEEIQEMGDYGTEEVGEALAAVQDLDPGGMGARDIKECLCIQLRHLGLEDTQACEIVKNHMDELERGRHGEIAKKLKISEEEVSVHLEVIRRLNPSPGSAYSEEESTYVIPDVYVYKVDDEYKISLNDEGLPQLRISPVYRNIMKKKESGDAEDFLKEKLRSALWFIKSVEQRQRTIFKVSESIVKHQREFLDNGIIYLKPMVLSDVADDIEMHQSTVSRVVNNKYIHTPQGLFEMRYFFHSGLQGTNGEDISSIKTKELIKRMVEEEDPAKPLSDSAIADELVEQGVEIARRTVAKYRKELRIPSSSQRRRKKA